MENVMNPTNLGAIFRSAAALGMDAAAWAREGLIDQIGTLSDADDLVIDAGALVHGNRDNDLILARGEDEDYLAVQLLGSQPRNDLHDLLRECVLYFIGTLFGVRTVFYILCHPTPDSFLRNLFQHTMCSAHHVLL